MKKNYLSMMLLCGLSVGSVHSAVAAQHSNKQVSVILVASGDSCFYFQPDGVTQADPTVSTSPIFAISRTDTAAKDMIAVLLTAKASGAPVTVDTIPGQAYCGGFARANDIYLN